MSTMDPIDTFQSLVQSELHQNIFYVLGMRDRLLTKLLRSIRRSHVDTCRELHREARCSFHNHIDTMFEANKPFDTYRR